MNPEIWKMINDAYGDCVESQEAYEAAINSMGDPDGSLHKEWSSATVRFEAAFKPYANEILDAAALGFTAMEPWHPCNCSFMSSGNDENDQRTARDYRLRDRMLHINECPNGCGQMIRLNDEQRQCVECGFEWWRSMMPAEVS